MGEVVSFEDIYCEKVANRVWDMATALEEDGVELLFMPYQIDGLLHQFYHLYQSKGIIYSYQEDMQSYFATIFDYISEEHIPSISFLTIIDGFFYCYEMMSPVEIERSDFTKSVSKVKSMINLKGEGNHAR